METLKIITYLMYVTISVSLTIIVANVLYKNGKIFLMNIFQNSEITDAVNKLLKTGFYLINIGWILSSLIIYSEIETISSLIEFLSMKIGAITILLGIIHFINMFFLMKIGKSKKITSQAN